MSMHSDAIRTAFFEECEDLLDALGQGLAQMADASADVEIVHAVFRAVHSIKGGAAAFSLDRLVTFAHQFETALDAVRSGRLEADVQAVALFRRCGDCLADLVAAAREDGPPPTQIEVLLSALAELTPPEDTAPPVETYQPIALTLDLFDAAPPTGAWTIAFHPGPALYTTGHDPIRILGALAGLGAMSVTLTTDEIGTLADHDVACAGLGWSIALTTDASETEIRAVFEFVEDLADLTITPPPPTEPGPGFLTIDDLGWAEQSGTEGVGAALAEAGPSPGSGAIQAPSRLPAPLPAPEATAERPALTVVPSAPPAPAPAARESRGAAAADPAAATIRVNLNRVDRLINLIGELVIKEAMLTQAIEKVGLTRDRDVSTGLDGIKQLASEIQESMMSIRAQPLKPVFQRMDRIVREAADATGKAVRFVTVGEQTEVDRTVIEKLVDPLTHMIRNSVDHGLESADRRLAAGKPAEGVITLTAAHRSGRVVIDVSDDGGGINRARVREIAEARGLVVAGATMGPSDIDALLFMPGFSSKDEVSALSGRGVGLDVVRREIQALGGRVTIQSVEGKGTTFSVALPLTLAVLEGMMVEVAGQTMVVPITAIQESLRLRDATTHAFGTSGLAVRSRGDLIPVIDVASLFGLRGAADDTGNAVLMIVETDTGRRAALLVNRILDQRQVVIKSLEENYGRIAAVSSATILGDGRIALILDPEDIVNLGPRDCGGAILDRTG